MIKNFILFFTLFFTFSCNNRKQDNKIESTSKDVNQDYHALLQTTVIADLPGYLQPHPVYLKNVPKPKTTAVPKRNQFIHGDGGISNFTTYNTDDGLALDAISSSCMDQFGNLWFGTYGGGISRFDGKSFVNYTTSNGLANNTIKSVKEDRKGNLWFGTYSGGVSRYDGKSFVNYTTSQGLADNTVLCITQDKKGNLWFGTNGGGVSRYDGKIFVNFTTSQGLANNNVLSIIEDRQGNLWFGTEGGGISRLDSKFLTSGQAGMPAVQANFLNFTTSQGLADNYVNCITEDKLGNLWLGTNAGVSRFNGNSHSSGQTGLSSGQVGFTNFTTSQGLSNNTVLSITEDINGNLWFGTDGGGISRFDGKTFVNYTTSQGLSNKTVLSITQDKLGNLWFGTDGGGVSRYNGNTFVNFTTAHGLPNNNVYSITEDKSGNLWFGTYGGGVSCFDGRSFLNFTTSQGLANNNVYSATTDKYGNLWFGTNGGEVSCYDGKFTNYTSSQGLSDNIVSSIIEDKNGNLWFGTFGGGVTRYNGNSPHDRRTSLPAGQAGFVNYTTAQGLSDNNVYCIKEDKDGNLWFGTNGGGVSCFDGTAFVNFTTSQGLSGNIVLCIAEDLKGNLWFGTQNGLSYLNASERKKLQENKAVIKSGKYISNGIFKKLTTADGLPDNFVTQIVEGIEDQIYAGTNAGIVELNWKDSGWKVVRVYNSSTGNPVKDVNVGQNGMFKDSKGIIWIATGSDKTGLVRFDTHAAYKNLLPPKVILQKVRVGEASICWYDLQPSYKDSTVRAQQEIITIGRLLSQLERDSLKRKYEDVIFDSIPSFYPLPVNLILPYKHNNVSFDFAALETGVNFSVRYQYLLDGYSSEWSPVTDKTSANFGNINEGTYTFKLKARSPEGIWSEPISYSFKVLPPWWRRWWAHTSFALLFLLALRIFTKRRERRLIDRQKFLEKTVEERTAELKQKNIIVEKQKEKVEKQKEVIEKEKQRSDYLLLNILPEEIAEELKAKGSAEAKQFEEVSVMFTDFKGFTRISENLTPSELVAEIDTCFKAFDNIISKYSIEKIKTIGDSYMCAGGLPVANKTNAIEVVSAAMEILQFMEQHLLKRKNTNKELFEIRIGVHTGPVVAGIVGFKKFAYDIWGDAVNIAARMESSGKEGKVNISGRTYELVKDKFYCTYRGKIYAKNKGEIDMYFVDGPKRTEGR